MRKVVNSSIVIFYLALCFIATSCLSVSAEVQSSDSQKFTNLFDGKTLNGWDAYEGTSIVHNTKRWSVEDGVIMGKPHESCGNTCINTWLVSNREYSDFILRFKYKIEAGNSGFTYRSIIGKEALDSPEVDFSADEKTTGQIYETRTINNTYVHTGYLTNVDTGLLDTLLFENKFNEMELRLKGSNIKVFLNGTLLTNYDHDVKTEAGRPKGFIAMELHQDTIISYKDIEILEW